MQIKLYTLNLRYTTSRSKSFHIEEILAHRPLFSVLHQIPVTLNLCPVYVKHPMLQHSLSRVEGILFYQSNIGQAASLWFKWFLVTSCREISIQGTLPLLQLSISFKISCFEEHSLYVLLFQELSLKLIDNYTRGSATFPCIYIFLLIVKYWKLPQLYLIHC